MIDTVYNELYIDYSADLGHYFRNLYHIFKFVDESEGVDKKRYANIVRAQLSKYEILLLFYNGLSDLGGKFKKIIEDYSLIKHIEAEELLDNDHISLYGPKAYSVKCHDDVFY